MRHNTLRNLNELQQEVCKDVVVKPNIPQLNNKTTYSTHTDRAAPAILSGAV